MKKGVLVLLLAMITLPLAAQPLTTADELAWLDARLKGMSDLGKFFREMNRNTMYAATAGILGTGFLFSEVLQSVFRFDSNSVTSIRLYTLGCATATGILGTISLLTPSPLETLYSSYLAIPQSTEAEMTDKLLKASLLLQETSAYGETMRIIFGLGSLAASVVLYVAWPNPVLASDLPSWNQQKLLISLGTASFGAIMLLIKTAPEMAWSDYQAWRKDRGVSGRESMPPVDVAVHPVLGPDGRLGLGIEIGLSL